MIENTLDELEDILIPRDGSRDGEGITEYAVLCSGSGKIIFRV